MASIEEGSLEAILPLGITGSVNVEYTLCLSEA